MKLGDVLRKERERSKLSIDEIVSRLGVPRQEYESFENGLSEIEEWGPRLGQIAIKLKTPTSRLIGETGKYADARNGDGNCGKLIKAHRERRQLSQEELAQMLSLSTAEIAAIEDGKSPIEHFGPVLLGFAEAVNQPIFNLFYPCGLPLDKLTNYP
jgi:transcriptional regulator with XRE-family HTH domain